MGNDDIMDSLVSKEALQQLDNLNEKLAATYLEMEKLLAAANKGSDAFSKFGKSFTDITRETEKSAEANKNISDTLVKVNKLEDERNKLFEVTIKAQKEKNQVMLNDLKISKELDDYMKNNLGTLEQNAKLLLSYKNELKAISNERARMAKAEKDDAEYTSKLNMTREEMIVRENQLKIAMRELQTIMQNEQKILNSTSGSLDNASLQLTRMKTLYRQLTDELKSSPMGQELHDQIKVFDDAVKQSAESIGESQRSVGDYSKGFRDLGRVIGMVNPQIGAMVNRVQSISSYKEVWVKANNRLTTSLNVSTKAARALMFTGIGILIAGIAAAVVLYQKWNKERIEAKKIQSEVAKNTQEEITKIQALEAVLKNAKNEYNVRYEALLKLKEIMPTYNAQLSEEGRLINDNTDALRKYVAQLKDTETLKIYTKRLADAQVKYDDFINSLEEGKRKIVEERIASGVPGYGGVEIGSVENVRKAKAYLEDIEKLQNKVEDVTAKTLKNESNMNDGTKSLIKVQEELLKQAKLLPEATEEEIAVKNRRIQQINDEISRLQELGKETKKQTGGQAIDKSVDAEKKAYYDLSQFKIKLEADAQKQIASDTEKSFAVRFEAYHAYMDRQVAMIEKQREFELSNEQLTQSGRELINLTADEKIREARAQVYKEIRDMDKKCFDEMYKNAQEYFQQIESLNASKEQTELVDLSSQYAAGLVQREDYEQRKVEIAKKYAILTFEEEIKYLEEQLKRFDDNAELQEQIAKQLAKAKADYAKYAANAEIKANEESVKTQISAYEALKEYLNTEYSKTTQHVWETLLDTMNMFYDEQLNRIDELEKREKEYYDEKLKTIEENAAAGLMSEEEADARRRIIEQTQLEREKGFEKQRKDMQKKQAEWQKANAMIQAMINTGVAITAAIATQPVALGIVLAAIVGAMGAAQVAMIASKSIPSYAHGTEDHPGGLAVVGDAGRPEMVITPSGKVWKTPARDTLAFLPKGTEVLPDFRKALEAFTLPALQVYDDRKGDFQFSVFSSQFSDVRKNTRDMNNHLSSINTGIRAIRANSMYSEKRGYLLYRINKRL